MSNRPQLYDNHGRAINYVRLAVTDRCNLRCFYCMPEEGINFTPRNELMSYEEMLRLIGILARCGVSKVRITGGEPFVRRDIMQLLRGIAETEGIETLNLTTNGTLTAPHVAKLKALGIKSVNLSLDSLDPKRFFEVTRRDEFAKVWHCFEELLRQGIKVKINAVVMEGKNEADILEMVDLTKKYPVSVRFIEEMPFNGSGNHYDTLRWNWQEILKTIKTEYPTIQKLQDEPNSTSYNYMIPNHLGTVGIIAAYSRTFCGTCNRIRVTPQGLLKTCLYDSGVFNFRDLMRAGASDEQIASTLLDALGNRAKNGFEAENRRFMGAPVRESMTTIGG
ncbi:MAG: GTP 3',8-cyclase MoaA [Saprospiraceae bacterium]|nr:GTP 3',8-cyclase MoaA [Saprospiraceae bacterium]